MKKRDLKKRVSIVPDPDYPVKHRTVTTTLTLPGADAETVAKFQATTIEFNIPNRIEAARQSLPQIAGLPEHAAASSWLRKAAACWNDSHNPLLPVALRDIAAGTADEDGALGGALGAIDRLTRKSARDCCAKSSARALRATLSDKPVPSSLGGRKSMNGSRAKLISARAKPAMSFGNGRPAGSPIKLVWTDSRNGSARYERVASN